MSLRKWKFDLPHSKLWSVSMFNNVIELNAKKSILNDLVRWSVTHLTCDLIKWPKWLITFCKSRSVSSGLRGAGAGCTWDSAAVFNWMVCLHLGWQGRWWVLPVMRVSRRGPNCSTSPSTLRTTWQQCEWKRDRLSLLWLLCLYVLWIYCKNNFLIFF